VVAPVMVKRVSGTWARIKGKISRRKIVHCVIVGGVGERPVIDKRIGFRLDRGAVGENDVSTPFGTTPTLPHVQIHEVHSRLTVSIRYTPSQRSNVGKAMFRIAEISSRPPSS